MVRREKLGRKDTYMYQTRKIGVVGQGHVGAHVANSLLMQGIADELYLCDINEAKVTSEVQDLRDSLSFVPYNTKDAYPTGLAMPAANIAIPHTDPGFVAKPYIAVVKPAAPVTFNAMAGMGAPVPAQIVINLGIAEPGGQVEALQALMNIFMDADVAADVLGQTTPQGMVDAIRRHF